MTVMFLQVNEKIINKLVNHLVDPQPMTNARETRCVIFLVCIFLIVALFFVFFIYSTKVILTHIFNYCLTDRTFSGAIFVYTILMIVIILFFSISLTFVLLANNSNALLADSGVTLIEPISVREEQFWSCVNACNSNVADRIKEIYGSSDCYFIYTYIATDIQFYFSVYPEIAMQLMHEVSLGSTPELIIQIVDAARQRSLKYGTN